MEMLAGTEVSGSFSSLSRLTSFLCTPVSMVMRLSDCRLSETENS